MTGGDSGMTRRPVTAAAATAALGICLALALLVIAPTATDAQCVGTFFNSGSQGQAFCRGSPLYPYGVQASMDTRCFPGTGSKVNVYTQIDTSTANAGQPIKWLLYGTAYTSFYINSNFLLSFTQPIPTWSVTQFPMTQGAVIAPFWASTDATTNGGQCMYRIVTSGSTLTNCTNDVRSNYLLGQQTFTATACLIITWDNHQLFGQGVPYDTVQLILATDNTATYSMFHYGQYTQGAVGSRWRAQSTNMASQGGYPTIGFDSGDGSRFYVYSGSGTSDTVNAFTYTNTRPTLTAGRVIFRVSDSVIVDPPVFLLPDANITSITTTPPFTLSPAYNSLFVGPYTVYVNASQQLTIAANLSDPAGAALFIDGSRKGSGVPSGTYTISSTQTVTLAVTAADGTRKTYTMQFLLILSPIAGLSAMSIAGLSYDSPVTSFSQSVFGYTINLASTGSAQSVRLQCTSLQSQGTIRMGLYGPVTGSLDVSGIALNYPGNTVFYVVSTSEDGVNVRNYNITFNLVLSQVTTLFSFVSTPTLPWVVAGQTYSATVTPATTQIVVTATTTFVAATARFSGGSAARNIQIATLPLSFFTNTFQLTVTAENTAFASTYTISVYRPPSTNANLTSLTVTTGLGVAFAIPNAAFAARAIETGSGANASYVATITVTPQTPAVTLTPVLADAVFGSAKLGSATLNTGLPSTSQTLTTDPLNGATTSYVVYVTAQDGVTLNTWRVNVVKPAVPTTSVPATGSCSAYSDVFYTIESKAVRVILPTPTPAGTTVNLVADCAVNKTGEAARLWFSKSALPNFATGTFVSASTPVTAADTYSMTAVAFAQSTAYAGASNDWYLTYAANSGATVAAYAVTCNVCAVPVTQLDLYTSTTAVVTRNRWAFYSVSTPSWMTAAAIRFDMSPQLVGGQGINTQYYRTYAVSASPAAQATPTDWSAVLSGSYVSGTNPTSGANTYTQSVLAPGANAYLLYGIYAISDGVSNIQSTSTYSVIAQPPVPVITLAAPVSGPTIGGPALAVLLTVTNAEPVGSAVSNTLWVTIGGKNCTALAYDSQGRIQCTPPAGEGTGNAFQMSLYFRASPAFSLTYAYTAPAITQVSPSNGPTLGLTSIVITGTNLGQSATVTVGGKACAVTNRAVTTITCTTQAGEGVALVLVTVAGQTSASTPLYFTFDRPAPLTYVSPYTGTAGVTATPNALILWGSNFGSPTAAVSVTIGGAAATVASWNHTVIVCSSVPAGSGTSNNIVVTVSTRASTNTLLFAYAPPTITSVAPNPVPFGTTALVFTGTNFGPSSNAAFNSINALGGLCAQTSVSSTSITCTPPARTAGLPSPAFVVINGQQSATYALSWVAPVINTVTSFVGDAAGTTALTLLGVGFSGVDTSVRLNGAACTLTGANNDTALGIVMPAGSGTNLPLQVYVGGVFSNTLYLNYTRPTITSIAFSPSASPATDGSSTAIINGLSFSGTTGTVTVVSSAQNTVATCTSPSWSTAQISCSFPSGTGPVTVVVTVGGQSSLPFPVTYAAPTFTSLTPSTGVTTAGGALLQINGGNFGASQPTGATVVFFLKSGPVPCTSYSSWSNTAIGCIVPAGNGTGITVTVTIAAGVSVSTNTFSYLAPAITAVSSAGSSFPTAGAQTITITGTSLDSGGTVTVNGTGCPVLTWVNGAPGTITCTLPVGGGANQLVQVRGVGGQNSPSVVGAAGAGSLTYDKPAIGLVTPNPSSAGQSVTLVGINFGSNPLLASVVVGADAGTITFLNQTAVIFTLSKAPSSSTPVITYTYAGQSGTITAGVTPPFINALVPPRGPTGPAYNLTIQGLNFGDGSQPTSVTVGVRNCPVMAITGSGGSSGSVVCLMPLGGTNAQVVQVTVGSQPSNTLSFQYDAPFITSVSPNTALDTGGSQAITLSGSSFSSNPSITVGGTSCLSVTPLNDTMAVCSTPSLVGSGLSVVLTAGAQSSNTNVTVSYATPVLTLLTPATDSPVGGTNLVLSGTGFGPGGSLAGTITVGGVSCPVASGSGSYTPTSVTCVLPPGSGAVNVIIRVNGVNSNARTFTYFAPVITGVTAQGFSAPQTGGGTTVIIAGQYFSATVGSVSVNGTYSCVVTQSSQWTNGAITCTMPALAGTVSVVVTAGGQASNTFLVTYAAPAITSISPANGPTVGGTTVFITGTNLFTSGVATIGGYVCTPSGTKWTNTRIECTTPAGVGDAQQVRVTVFGQFATFTSFTYNPPTISAIVPSFGPTNALRPSSSQVAFPIGIYGTNFGVPSSGQVVVSFGGGGNTCTVAFQNQTYVQCASVPNGVGTGVSVRVAVVGQFATTTTLFAYTAPSITSITSSGCTVKGNTVVDCPIAGGVLLTLNGANFGFTAAATSGSPAVSVNGVSAACTSPTYPNEDGNSLTCTLPSGSSYDIPVSITVAGQTSNSLLIAYAGPTLGFGSLRVLENDGAVVSPVNAYGMGAVTLPDIDGSALLYFNGTFLSPWYPTDPLPGGIRFGTTGTAAASKEFFCNVTTYSNTDVYCRVLGYPIGQTLTFAYNDGLQWSRETLDSITFPAPVLMPGTISSPGNANAAHLAGSSNQGEFVQFDAKFVGNDASLLHVWYGVSGSNFTAAGYQCTSVSIATPYNLATDVTRLQCRTSPGTGGNFVFKVVGLNQWSAEGTDTYAYPTPPVVNAVFGCQDSVSTNSTAYCPTTGGTAITLLGTSFSAVGATAKVGTSDCIITYIDSGKIVCTLPGGTGANVAVSVFAANLLSAPVYLLSYQPAYISSVKGCTNNADGSTSNCARTGNTLITITGQSFGASGAQVFIGATACTSVMHDGSTPQSVVTCYTPQGVDAAAAVLLLQSSGALSNNTGLLGYAQCPLGTYQAGSTDYACTNCGPGTFTDTTGQLQCASCPIGRAQPGFGFSTCSQCALGSYTPSVGYSTCQNCTAGQIAGSAGQAGCVSCGAGTYSSGAGATVCLSCPIGSAYDGTAPNGVSACSNCTRGSFTATNGRSACSLCAVGSFNTYDGASQCQACAAGKFLSGSSGTVCSDCALGSAVGVTGSATCPACNPGRFANVTGLTACAVCDAGTYSGSPASLTACSACAAGSYQPASGQGQCLTCPAGSFAGTSGAQQCTSCAAGTAGTPAVGTGLTACSNCTAGYAAPSSGQGACTQCPAGTFSLANAGAQATCQPCGPGTFSPSAGATACVSCGVAPSTLGTYNANSGQSACASCDIGFFGPTTGLTECGRCAAGRYSGALGSSTCTDCGAGYITNSDAQPLAGCVACAAGSFSSAAVSTTCTPCSAGESTVGVTGAQHCTACLAGQVATTSGSKVCTDCGAGYFANTTGLSTCSPCGTGSYSSTGGASPGPTSCTLCAAGRFAPNSASATCIDCAAGSFSNITGASACTLCDAGSFQGVAQQTSCSPCAAGSAIGQTGQASCQGCSAGSYAEFAGMTACISCAAGSIASSGNALTCSNCTAGSFARSAGLAGCTPCDVGSIAASGGATTCVQCSAGTVQPNPSGSTCNPCVSGEYQPSAGLGACLECPLGEYSNTSALTGCYKCDVGFFGGNAKMTACVSCGQGKFAASPGLSACSDCSIGTYAPAPSGGSAGASTCVQCDAGTYQDQAQQSSCKTCPAGAFCVAGATTFTPCPAGQYQDQMGRSSCFACPLGQYCPAGSTVFLNCSAGTYSASSGSSICVDCAPGFYANTTAATECSQCIPGYATSALGSTVCAACIAGQISYGFGGVTCTDCSAGTYSATSGQSRCAQCDAATAQPNAGKASCIPCADGQYAPSPGAAACFACPVGTFAANNNLGSSGCTPCAAGKIAAAAGSSVCSDCTIRSYVSNSGQGACVQCGAGTFANVTGLTSCYPCGAGTFSQKDGAGNGVSVCSQCDVGTFSSSTGFSACLACGLGTATNVMGQTTCGLCGPQQAQPQTGQVSCTDCLAGTYASDNGTIQCVPCPPGSVQPNGAQESCLPCDAGKYQSVDGKTECIECERGKYMSSPGAVTCTACPLGQAQPQTGQQTCVPCDRGTANSVAGRSACTQCTPGFYTDNTNQVTCQACPAGSISVGYGNVTCRLCETGTYQPSAGQSVCRLCPIGFSAPAPGQSSCTPCAAGSYTDVNGTANCFSCGNGTFSNDLGSTACSPCSAGYWQKGGAQLSCQPCAAGTYNNDTGLTECHACEPGTYSANPASTTCLRCVTGTQQPNAFGTACTNCRPGTYSNSDVTKCTPCPPGYYQDSYNSGDCLPCNEGHATAVMGTISCAPCMAGQYMPTEGNDTCLPCPTGMYMSSPGASVCLECGVGTFGAPVSGPVGLIECQACAAGSFSNTSMLTACHACEPGHHQAQQSQTACDLCGVGKFTDVPNQAQCLTCGGGRFAATNGSTTCLVCGTDTPLGTYNSDATGHSECYDCPVGTFSTGSSVSACGQCAPGSFTNITGQTVCVQCNAGQFQLSAGATECEACHLGAFNPAPGASICSDCLIGYKCNATGLLAPLPCQKAQFQNAPGKSACEDCLAGSFGAATASSSCTPCSPGFYDPHNGTTACLTCTAGSYQNAFSGTECLQCDPGRYSLDGAAQCSLCAAGSYANVSGLTSCAPCEQGKYQDAPGYSECWACQPGRANSNTGRPSCDPCAAGSYTNGTGAFTCSSCPPGSSQPQTGQPNCTLCDLGSANPDPGQALCTSCSAGSFANVTGLTVCQECFGGTYQDQPAATVCKGCEVGTASVQQGLSICPSCGVGTYTNVTGKQQCDDCEPGTYQDTPGLSSCAPCAMGTFSVAPHASSCAECAAGSYSDQLAAPICTGCTSGLYQPYPRATACLRCVAGQYSTGINLKDCTDCPAGTYTNDTGYGECIPCGPGSFQANPGKSSCDLCGVGKAVAGTGALICIDCESGRFANESGWLECQACLPGTATSRTGTIQCEACAKGHQQPSSGALSCEPCEAGTYTSINGTTLCAPCDKGTAEPQTGATSCAVCQPGSYADVQDLSNCKPCPAGSFSNTTGLTQCHACNPGRAAPSTGLSACAFCAMGTATALPRQSQCQSCAGGSFTNVTGQLVCTPCPLGSAQPATGRTACAACSTGSYADVSGLSVCKPCAQGNAVNKTGSTACVPCAASTYAPSQGFSVCQPCPAATFSEGTGQASCTPCQPGRFAAAPGNAQCTFCQPGTYQPNSGNDTCLPCELGTAFGGDGAQVCTACSAGSFANVTGLKTCTLCPGGKFQIDQGTTACVDCPMGTSSPLAGGATQCTPCSPGSFTLGGAVLCDACPTGQFQPQLQQTACLNCTKGQFSGGTGARQCSDCGFGRYTTTNGSSECQFCQPGYYQDETGKTDCKFCPIASYSPQPGAQTCRQCDPGTFGNATLTANCYPCPKGQFQSLYGRQNCTDCGVGKFLDRTGGQSCDLCPAGTYSDRNGTITCTPCPAGQFNGGLGATSCEPCGPGTYSLGNAGSCTPCAAGTFSTEIGRDRTCDLCPIGQSQPAPGKTNCTECGLGVFSGVPGLAVCSPCGFGTKGNSTGLTVCVQCDIGEYQNTRGKSACSKCQLGTYSVTPGLQQCVNCAAGKFGNDTGATDCHFCAKGTYQDVPGKSSCSACPLGRFGTVPGEQQCSKCAPGTFGNSTGALDTCTPCPKATYQDQEGALNCTVCELGSYNDKTGQPDCVECPTSTFSNVTGLEECHSCLPGTFQNAEGKSSCALCPPGTASTAGQITCPPCGTSTATGKYGTENQCTTCQLNSIPNPTKTQCECEPGYYLPNYNNEPAYTIFSCLPCPTGADCRNIGTQFSTLAAASGYWRPTNTSLTFYRCIIRSYCVGGEAMGAEFSSTSGSGCTAHRQGIMCSYCEDGYRAALGSTCVPCPSGWSGYVTLVLGGIALGVVFLLSMYVIAKSGHHELRMARFLDVTDQIAMTGKAGGSPTNSMIGDADGDAEEKEKDGKTGGKTDGKTPRTPGVPADEDSADEDSMSRSASKSLNSQAKPKSAKAKRKSAGEGVPGPADSSADDAKPKSAKAKPPLIELDSGAEVAPLPGSISRSPAAGAGSAVELAVAPTPIHGGAEHGPVPLGEQGAFMSSGPSARPASSGPSGPLGDAPAVGPAAPGMQSVSSHNRGSRLPPLGQAPSAAGVAAIHAAAAPSPPAPVPASLSSAAPDVKDEKHRDSPDVEAKDTDAEDDDGEGETADDGDESGSESDSAEDAAAATENNAKSPRLKGNFVDSDDDDDVADTNAWMNAKDRAEMWDVQAQADERKFAGLYKDASDPQVLRQRTIHGPPVPIGDITFKMKIFLSFLQIVTTISTSLDVQWPNTFTNIVQDLDVVNFRSLLQNVGSTDCIQNVNYYVTFLIVCCVPLVVLLLLLCCYVLPLYLRLCCFRMYHANERRRSIATFYRLFLYCLFLLYPGVSSTIILHYNCIDVEGTSYLKVDLRVQCGTDTWSTFALATLPLIILYPIGVPLFFGVLLRANRDKLRDPFIRAQLGFLYAGYRKHAWWFELLDLTHKLVLTSLLAFLATSAQLPVAMCVIVIYTIVILRVSPYVRPDDDQLHLFSQIELLLFVLAGWVFYSMDVPSYSDEDDIIISVCLVAAGVLFIVLFVWQAGFAAYRTILKWCQRRQKQKAKKAAQAAANASAPKDDDAQKPELEMVERPPRDAGASPAPGAAPATDAKQPGDTAAASGGRHKRNPTATPGFTSAIMKAEGGAAATPQLPPIPKSADAAGAPRKSVGDNKAASDASEASASDSEDPTSSSASASGTDDANAAASPSAPAADVPAPAP